MPDGATRIHTTHACVRRICHLCEQWRVWCIRDRMNHLWCKNARSDMSLETTTSGQDFKWRNAFGNRFTSTYPFPNELKIVFPMQFKLISSTAKSTFTWVASRAERSSTHSDRRTRMLEKWKTKAAEQRIRKREFHIFIVPIIVS